MRRHLMLLLLLAFGAAGCSGGSAGGVEGGGPTGHRLYGRVLLDVSAAGAAVEAVGTGSRDTTDATGGFALSVPSGPLLLVATVDGARYRRVLAAPLTHAAYVNAVTNLVALYLETHRDVPVAEAEARVKAFLRIPPGVDAAYGVEELPGSPFSHRVFLAEAAANGGVESFSRTLAGQVDGGPPRAFVSEASKAWWKDLGLQVAADLGTDVLTGVARGLVGWALSAMNVNLGEAGELRDLAAQIEQITAQTGQIQDDVIRAFAAGDLQSLTNTLEQDYTTPFDQLNKSYVDQLNSVTPTGLPRTPSQELTALVQSVLDTDVLAFLAVLDDAMQGRNLSPCVTRLLAAQRNAQVGAGMGDSLIVVENGSIATMAAVYDYYASYQTLGFNMLAESVHVADAPAAGIQLARGFAVKFFADLKAQSLLVPVPWKNRVVLDRGGSMWNGTLQADVDGRSVLDYAPNGTYHWAGAGRSDWQLPTSQQVDRLSAMMKAGIYGPDLAAQGPGPALQELGFDVTGLGGHTKIWLGEPGPKRYDLVTGQVESVSNLDDTYPAIWVRNFPDGEDADTARTAGVPRSIAVSALEGRLTATAVMDVAGETVAGVDVTDRVVWTSANPALLEVSNSPGHEGEVAFRHDPDSPDSSDIYVYASDRPIRVQGQDAQTGDAVWGRILMATDLVPAPPVVSLSLTPRNVNYAHLPTSRQYYVTAWYADGSVRDVTSQAACSVQDGNGNVLPAAEGAFSSSVPGVLQLHNALTHALVTLQATSGGQTATTRAGAPVFEGP